MVPTHISTEPKTGTSVSTLTTDNAIKLIRTDSLYVWVARMGTTPVTDVTWNGVSLEYYATQDTALSNASVDLWVLWDPTDASSTVTATMDSGVATMILIAQRYSTTRHSGDNIVDANFAANTTSPITTSLAGAVDTRKLDVALVWVSTSGATISVNEGTARFNTTAGATTNIITLAGHDRDSTGGGADTLSWNESTNREWGQFAITIAPAPIKDVLRAGQVIPYPR